jgi:fatty-acyl-CoA synthase
LVDPPALQRRRSFTSSGEDRRATAANHVAMETAILPTKPPPSAPEESVNKAWLRALALVGQIDRAPDRTLPHVVEEQAVERPGAAALLSDEAQLSYGDLASLMRRYARFALAQGIGKGEVVALMAHNHPGYMAAWLGLTSVGAVVALVNTNLRGEALAHCLATVSPRLVIATKELAATAREAAAEAPGAPAVWLIGPGEDVETALQSLPDHPLALDERRGVTVRDPALLIYTSGTTGLPKAAFVSHRRVMSWSCWFAGLLDVSPADRLYDCLPMYHSVGGVVATGALLVRGGSVVVARKFSAGRFWDEVVRWDCTLFQYIGELCRYLVKAAPSANERRHRLRLACGNGLSGAVWREFQARFAVPRIVEFYAATEGNFSLFNLEGEPGAIGRLPGFMAHRFPVAIVAFDAEAGAPRRGPDGRCIRCERGEAGEAIGRISAPGGDASHSFEGYTSAAESERKVLRDVFEPGDAWLRTGDLMRIDERGFFRFVDRVGDTFRWKGENVSAAEVARVVEACPGVEAAAVYGVAVPHADGRAGMAAVVTSPEFDLDVLRARLAESLPDYARPLFVRIVSALPTTETFKKATHRLAAESFDPSRSSDQLYIEDPAEGGYASLTRETFERIARGELRL